MTKLGGSQVSDRCPSGYLLDGTVGPMLIIWLLVHVGHYLFCMGMTQNSQYSSMLVISSPEPKAHW